MQLANTTMTLSNKFFCFLLALLPLFSAAQENSPYSRYGVGNLNTPGNIINRGMGGISASLEDFASVNTVNPASTGGLLYTTLDLGVEYVGRDLRSKNPLGSFLSNNAIISYLQIGIPLLSDNKKAQLNHTSWTLNFGLKPISRINYKVENRSVIGMDSIATIYEGNGGINEAFIGTAIKIKNFSFGFNTGYLFGEKDYSTKVNFLSDSVTFQKGNYETKTRFGGMFLNAGIQYGIPIKGGSIRMGLYGTLQKEFSASKDEIFESYTFSPDGGTASLDSVKKTSDIKGKVKLPATIGGGISFEKDHFLIGVDYETTQWNNYRFYGQSDLVKNNWIAKMGIQYYPANVGSTGYFNYVKYRAGFAMGNDYIQAGGKDLPFYTISVGGSFPLKLRRSYYDYQISMMNIAFEYGRRGNKENNLTENIYKISIGFSLSDMNWFQRPKYQ